MYSYIKFLFLVVISLMPTNVFAAVYTLEQAEEQFLLLKLQQPDTVEDGRIMTLNSKGAMFPITNDVTKRFIEEAEGKKVLEIGGAYGKVMIETLLKNRKVSYHFYDLSEDHLFIAAHNLLKGRVDKSNLEEVRFISGDISKEVRDLEQYDSVYTANVLHFFTPKALQSSISNIHKLLKHKGKVYVVAVSPYLKRYEAFIPVYEKRLKDGDEYPGFVKSRRPYMNRGAITVLEQDAIDDNSFMFLDDKVLSKLFTQNGFKIIECKLSPIGFVSHTYNLDGRENVVMIAQKL